MKKIFIIIGIIIFILVVGVWAYLFTYGVPQNSDEIFARFGSGSNSDSSIHTDTTQVDVANTDSTGAQQALKQLTIRPVAGAAFVENSIRYVEQGTGHIYSIDLTTGVELLISGTTIPGAHEAFFSPNGSHVAITLVEDGISKTLAGLISSGVAFSGVALPDGAKNIAFNNATGTLQYTITEASGTVGYSYNIQNKSNTRLFTLPLQDIRILWGNPTYAYTTPTTYQTGYIYRIVKDDLMYVTGGAPGLMAFRSGTALVLTSIQNDFVETTHILENADPIRSPFSLLPEKCIAGDTFTYCAIPKKKIQASTFPDSWYKGITTYADGLWRIDVAGGKATSLVDFEETSGRSIDVLHIGADNEGKRIFLINKNDNTLWLFDTTL